jgi:hypothetical protein
MELSIIPFLLFTIYVCGYSQSQAHKRSTFAIIDPAYSSTADFPKSNLNATATPWIYGSSELECWRLQVLQQRKDSAMLNVGYTGVFHKPYNESSFRIQLSETLSIKKIKFRAVGYGSLYLNDIFYCDFLEKKAFQSISIKTSQKIKSVQFNIKTNNDLPALLIEDGSLSTSNPNWTWKAANIDWSEASRFEQNLQNVPPHRLEDPTIKLKPVSVKNKLYDFGRELLGDIFFLSDSMPTIGAGESEPEALVVNASGKAKEQSLDMVNISKGVWKTKTPVAFRYVFLENSDINKVWTEAMFCPETYRGAFACSDTVLTRIWMNSAYTLRLCMRDFLLDGIKRDRLPWAGDLAMSSLVNAFSFYDKELVRRSLVALGREGIKEMDINGIADFSLWWIITQDQYQLYFSDTLHLKQEWNRIKEALNTLNDLCDTNGFMVPRKGARLFLDWVRQEKWTTLQIMWWWAQNCGAKLAHRVGDTVAEKYWTENALKFKATLNQAVWSEKKQCWLSKNDTVSEITRHPNFLAVASGLAEFNQFNGIKALLQDTKVKPVGSPYMAGYEVMALARLGDVKYMLNHVKEYWGGMLNKGATTFWEAYNTRDSYTRQYSFYSRPFGKSLCHAWSSGPAAFLPSELFGLKPLEDGWKRFTLQPNLGSLTWASVCVPTQYGIITVDIENKNMRVSIPKGCTLQWKDKQMVGPQVLDEKL